MLNRFVNHVYSKLYQVNYLNCLIKILWWGGVSHVQNLVESECSDGLLVLKWTLKVKLTGNLHLLPHVVSEWRSLIDRNYYADWYSEFIGEINIGSKVDECGTINHVQNEIRRIHHTL